MRQAAEIRGRPASEGIFIGPLAAMRSGPRMRIPTGSSEGEAAAFARALEAAIAELNDLIGRLEGEGADILAFQVAMLEDDALLAPARALIGSGQPADEAWRKTVDAEIVGYEISDDDYFRARATDMKDMRDRVLKHLAGEGGAVIAPGSILIGEDVAPTLFLESDWTRGGGIALTRGSASSHVAMLARARGVPMVVGLGDVLLNGHSDAVIDGTAGLLILSPRDDLRRDWARKAEMLSQRRRREAEFLPHPARLKDGTRIELLINVAGPEELDSLNPDYCDGIGLMRSEFLFRDGKPLPDEDAQYRAYRRFVEWAGEKPVTIRTLDIGGDKPIKGLTPEGEGNPFLGVRGVRLTLARKDVFRTQLRALARAAVLGNLKIMVPMITVADELVETASLLDQVMGELAAEGVPARRPPLGIMVEVPAVAIEPELLAEAAFFSIGSNDLTQYVMAAARDEGAVSRLSDAAHPAVLKLIANVCRVGRERGIPVSLCGDMASDPAKAEALIKAGLRAFSVTPTSLGRIKAALAEVA